MIMIQYVKLLICFKLSSHFIASHIELSDKSILVCNNKGVVFKLVY